MRSNAARSGARHACCQPGPPPVPQPQSSFHRPTPCARRPRALLDLHLPVGRLPQSELGESPGREPASGRLDRERVGNRPLAPTVVMTERLTVWSRCRRRRDRRRRRGDARRDRRAPHSTASPTRRRRRVRAASVVEDDPHAPAVAARVTPLIRASSVDRAVVDRDPFVVARASESHPHRLARSQDREADAFLGEHREHLVVHGGLGEPHPLCRAAEPEHEVGESPTHLRRDVAPRRERQDQVAVPLRDRAAAVAPGSDDRAVHVRPVVLEPRHERRPDVERHQPVVVDERDERTVVVEDARERVRSVALVGDSLVPVVRGRCRRLHRNGLGPGVLARGLVEVPVDHEPSVGHGAAGADPPANHTTDNGGSVTTAESAYPCHDTGSVSSPGVPPYPVPQNHVALVSSSVRHDPP